MAASAPSRAGRCAWIWRSGQASGRARPARCWRSGCRRMSDRPTPGRLAGGKVLRPGANRQDGWSKMPIDLTPTQKKLRGLAREIAEGFVRGRAAETDRSEAYPWDNVRELTRAGLMGYTIPKELGGAGGSFLDAALVVEEMARVCGVTGRIVVEANMGAISAGMRYRAGAQKRAGPGPPPRANP